MATLNLDENQAHYQIRAYQPGALRVNDTIYTQSLIIAPDQLIDDWRPQTIDDVNASDLASILLLKPAILLIGTGSTLKFISPTIYGELINQGIGVEIMSTHSACSTYNALTAENRLVIAALIVK